MFCLPASLSLAHGYQEHFRGSFCRNPGCQHLRASASPLAPCITSLPLSPLLALPFLQYCYPHGPQPSGPLQHFLAADQDSSWSPPPFCWMLSPHGDCGSLNRLSCLNDPTDLNSLPWLCPSIVCASRDRRLQVLREGTRLRQDRKSHRNTSGAKRIPSWELTCTWGAFRSPQVLHCKCLSVEHPSVMTQLGSSGPWGAIRVYKMKWVHRNLQDSCLGL